MSSDLNDLEVLTSPKILNELSMVGWLVGLHKETSESQSLRLNSGRLDMACMLVALMNIKSMVHNSDSNDAAARQQSLWSSDQMG